MKQEIVVKVQMRCDKCRTKAMELVASADGVESVSLGGEDRNQLVVVGDGIDAVGLTSILRKKVGPTDIIKLGEPKKKNGKKNNGNKGDSDENDENKQKKKGKDSGKENDDKKKNGKKKVEKEEDDEEQPERHRYWYDEYHQHGPKMEYVQAQPQPQWHPAAYPSVVVYDSQPTYSNPNCSIM